MERQQIVKILGTQRQELSRRGVKSLRLFGPTARDEASVTSDVDLLVAFEATPSYSDFMKLRIFLEDLLAVEVDLVTGTVSGRGCDPRLSRRPSVSRDPLLLLEDIGKAGRRIVRYTEGRERDAVFSDDMRFDAVLHNLHVIGEAVKNLPSTFRERHRDIPWREIAGRRDFVAHAYSPWISTSSGTP